MIIHLVILEEVIGTPHTHINTHSIIATNQTVRHFIHKTRIYLYINIDKVQIIQSTRFLSFCVAAIALLDYEEMLLHNSSNTNNK